MVFSIFTTPTSRLKAVTNEEITKAHKKDRRFTRSNNNTVPQLIFTGRKFTCMNTYLQIISVYIHIKYLYVSPSSISSHP